MIAWLTACGFASPTGDGTGSDTPDAADPSSGAISFVRVVAGQSTDVAEVAVTVDVAEPATYVVGIATKSYVKTLGITGLGAQWTAVGDQCGGRSQTGVALYLGTGATSSGPITATLETAPSTAVIVAAAYRGVTTAGTIASHKSVAGTCSGSSDTSLDVTSYTFPIAPIAPASEIVAVIATRSRMHTPGDQLLQRAQEFSEGSGSSGSTAGIAIVDGWVDTISGTFSMPVDFAAIAVELRP